MAHTGGRPTEYKEEYIQKVDEYLLTCGERHESFTKSQGEKSESWERVLYVTLPKIESFCEFINIAKDTLYAWCKLYPGFSDAIDKIKNAQHNALVDGAISGRYNASIAKLMLSSNHGYKERTDVTTNNKDLPIPILGNVSNKHSDEENIQIEETN